MFKKNLFLSIVLGITLAACGGGGSGSTSTSAVNAGNGGGNPMPTPDPMPTPASITSLSVGTPVTVSPTMIPDESNIFINGITTTDDGGYRLFWQDNEPQNVLLFSQAFSANGAAVGEQDTGSLNLASGSQENGAIIQFINQSGDTLYHTFLDIVVSENISSSFSTFRGLITQDISDNLDEYFTADSTIVAVNSDFSAVNGNQLLAVHTLNDPTFLNGPPFPDTADIIAFIISPNGTASNPINIATDLDTLLFPTRSIAYSDSFAVVFQSNIDDAITTEDSVISLQRASFNGGIIGQPVTITANNDSTIILNDAATLSNDTALIIWEADTPNQSRTSDLKARIVDEAGSFVTDEFQINVTMSEFENRDARIVPLNNDQALVIWEQIDDTSFSIINTTMARVINADGTPATDIISLPSDDFDFDDDSAAVQLEDGSIILATDDMVLDITPVFGN